MPRRNFDLFDDDFFKDDFFTGREKSNFNLMKTDIRETEDNYLLDIDLPGYNKEDIKIDVTDGYLTINASMNQEKNEDSGNYVRRERFCGEVNRSFYVGEDIHEDQIKASFKNGILSLDIPKVHPEENKPEKKYIEISD
mgnify:CR=1 FL=1